MVVASCTTGGVVCQRCKAAWYCKVACCNKAKAAHFGTPECQARHAERTAARVAAEAAAKAGLTVV